MREWWARLLGVFSRRRMDDEMREEIETHLEMEVDGYADRGMAPHDARTAALRRFGNRTAIRESAEETWRFPTLETALQDARFGLRILRRSPGFAITATLVIALGIGATTAAFTLLDHVLLRPLAFDRPEQLVMLHQVDATHGHARQLASPPNVLDWRSMGTSFASMSAYLSAPIAVNLSGSGTPQRLDSILVTVDLFRTLGVQPIAGRSFTADDERDAAANIVLLRHAVAVSLFGDANRAVGRTLRLDNQPFTIVGVMPPAFVFPRPDAAMWRPLHVTGPGLANRSNHILFAVARLREGVAIADAQAEMDVVAERLRRAYPKDNAQMGIAVIDLRGLLSPQSRTLVVGVFAGAFVLMLIACTNLANLLFARAVARTPEVAVRVSIGAGRGRLLRQFITESLVLASLGGVAGALLAMTSTPLLARLVPSGLPIDVSPHVDLRVLTFATVLAVATSLAFGVAPAWRAARKPDLQALRARSTSGRRTDRLRSTLVVAEVIGTVTLLIAAGLLAKALWRVQAVDPGFQPDGALTLRTALPTPKYNDVAARRRFYEHVLNETRALPGVRAVGYASFRPMELFAGRFPVLVPGVIDDPQIAPRALVNFVTRDYFAALGIPRLRGRTIGDQDTATAERVVMLSASLAEQLWPGQDPIGRRVRVAGDRTVVGVVATIATLTLEESSGHQAYFPADQVGEINAYYAPKDLIVRADGDPLALMPAVRRIVAEADPEQAISNVQLVKDVVDAQTAPRRDQLTVIVLFAAIAFVLAAVGVYGLLSFTVSVRTQELGIRVALGAARGEILGMFVRQALVLGAAGVILAMPLAYAAARGLAALLFGVRPGDPAIYGSAAALALAMTIAGSLYPAVRAAGIDPARTTRAE